jgi:UDP-glucose 4-epimerase
MVSGKKKTILVTGGAGFIGSHLCERLVKEGYRVISLDNYFTGSEDNHVDGVDYRRGDTREIETHISETPDIVFHLGEYSRVEQSLKEPDVVWGLNAHGTFSVLEFCRTRGSKLIYAGSSTKFGDGGMGRDQSPYAWTKASNTELVKNYGDWYNLPYAITYFYNVYGPREITAGPYATVIGIFKEQFLSGKPLTVVAPGVQKRNFTHVKDIVEGLVAVGENGEGDGYGLGNTVAYSILDIAKMFTADITMLPERKGNRMDSSIDTTRVVHEFNWVATEHVEDYIKQLVASKK